MSIQEIEAEAKKLPVSELDGLVNRLIDFFHECWDRQIETDLDKGRFDSLFDELEQEYKQGLTKPL
ncbi:hypothetical protein [uncultured Spirosoma sp.]|uniref:hypothetical protein n=1 Tax=uncultured Spirosoma sp. TaxID=278208 RepID=UPI00258C9F7F|nr:hypothetical protein [uncultured Spirosoma sp.]